MFVYHCGLNFLNLPVSHTNLFTVVKGELTVPEEALKVNTHTHNPSHTLICQHSSSRVDLFSCKHVSPQVLLYFLMSCSMKSLPAASSSAISPAAVNLTPPLTSLLLRRQQRPSSPQVAAEQRRMGSRLPGTLRLNLWTITKRRRGLEVRQQEA